MVVDDEEDLRRPILQSLVREGFEVDAAGSGPEALAIVEVKPPNLIILDLTLPGMDGIETLRRLRERVGEIKVVVITGRGTAQHVREALALGVREFLGKPFDLDRLLRIVVEEVVEGRTLRLAG